LATVADPPRFRQLLPKPDEREAAPLLRSAFAALRPPAERPYTLVNFVSSVDGRAAVQGRSHPLADDGDRALFHELRERADGVLAGTGTLSAERYGRLLSRPERRRRRSERGQPPEPLLCVVTRSGCVDTSVPLFAEPEARVVIFSAVAVPLQGVRAQVEVALLDQAELTLTGVLRALRARHGIRTLLCEGGPTLFGALLRERLVDELFLTIAPSLAGGGREPTITAGPQGAELLPLRLLWLLEREGSLYTRYALRGATRAEGAFAPRSGGKA
jgi:riboflavin-specific deaminase-like protein